MDLLLPGNAHGLYNQLAGYCPDLLIVFGFNWRLSAEILALPKLGVLNIHPSSLPRYRGPAPELWAIRNGDSSIGVTIHRMDEGLDTGPILAQRSKISLPEEVTRDGFWQLTKPVIAELLSVAVERAISGDPGTPQDGSQATYAGFPPPDWYEITWRDSRRRTHNQFRVLRHLNGGKGLVVEIDGRQVRVNETSIAMADGIRVCCSDGPLWITSWDEAPF
jgi:methionyl-tRNA formyltransferase